MTILEKIHQEILQICLDLQYLDTGEVSFAKYFASADQGENKFKFEVFSIDIENKKLGDMACNVAMVLAKKLQQSPKEIAENIVQKLQEKNIQATVAGSGFINIILNDKDILSELEKINNLANNYIQTKFSGQKILIEHSSPNLFKAFGIGHLMNNIIGEALVQMLKVTHAKIQTITFPSDISLGIAKAIYILKSADEFSNFSQKFSGQEISLNQKVNLLGQAYVEGVKFYDDNLDKQAEIKNLAKNLYQKNTQTEDWKIYQQAKEINVNYFLSLLKALGSNFDKLIYESEAAVVGEKIVRESLDSENTQKLFEVGLDGAIIFDTQKKLNKKTSETIKSVFINSEGHTTYEAKDLGLLKMKKDFFDFQKNLFITDVEQINHFETVLTVAKNLGGELQEIAEKSQHICHGRMSLKGEKMSSRLGNVLTAEEIFNLLQEKIKKIQAKSEKPEQSEDSNPEKIKNISLAALRIVILKSKPGLNIDFDPERDLSFEGATGPYLLYTYARAQSLITKAKNLFPDQDWHNLENKNLDFKISPQSLDLILNNSEIRDLVLKIIQTESVCQKAITELAPQIIVKYLFELTQTFNSFYAKVKILDQQNLESTKQNIILIKIFMKVLKFNLNMLGIQEVERM